MSSDEEFQLPREVWSRVRPYTVRLVADFIIAVQIWLLLWLFKALTTIAKIDGWPGEFFKALHAAGSILALGTFVGLLFWDIITVHRKGR